MSKRKLSDDIEENKNSKRAKCKVHRFEPSPELIIKLGNELLDHNLRRIWLDDDWCIPGCNNTNCKSLHQFKKFYLDAQGHVLVDTKIIESTNIHEDTERPYKAECLNVRRDRWVLDDVKFMKKVTLAELGYICKHGPAQQRSDDFAENVVRTWKPGEYVLILDGTGRNLEALLRVGIPASYIILVDKNGLTSLYHKLLSILLQEPFTCVWTKEYMRRACHGIEGMMEKGWIPHQNNIAYAYFDFDCDVPSKLNRLLRSGKLPNLKLYGVTQTKRNSKNKFPEFGYVFKDYPKHRVICKFMITNKYHQKETIFNFNLDDKMMEEIGWKRSLNKPNTWEIIK